MPLEDLRRTKPQYVWVVPRPRFSLRNLFGMTAVIAAFMGGIEWHRHHADVESEQLRDRLAIYREREAAQERLILRYHRLLLDRGIDISDLDYVILPPSMNVRVIYTHDDK